MHILCFNTKLNYFILAIKFYNYSINNKKFNVTNKSKTSNDTNENF